jgi:hypothetical protein
VNVGYDDEEDIKGTQVHGRDRDVGEREVEMREEWNGRCLD